MTFLPLRTDAIPTQISNTSKNRATNLITFSVQFSAECLLIALLAQALYLSIALETFAASLIRRKDAF